MSENQLLVNPKLSSVERQVFENLQLHFEKEFGYEGFFFVPSSGSSKGDGESAKLIALSCDAVANSAERFNRYFQAKSEDSWGLVLPTFHVAGLSVLARANLVKARVFSSDWVPQQMQEWLSKNKIAYLSLVPTQVHDLIHHKVKANSTLKKVFVGGGALNADLRDSFINLGWPVVETYGMTETCSMIAVKEDSQFFKVLPGVEILVEDDLLRVKCNSSAHSSIQLKNGKVEVTHFEEGWVRTEDRVKLEIQNNQLYLQFLGRASDYVKILGEGVSLVELRAKLEKVAIEFSLKTKQFFLLSLPDLRKENAIALIIDQTVDRHLADRLVERFNQVVRGYERIHKIVQLNQIPVGELGKVKVNELKETVLKQLETQKP